VTRYRGDYQQKTFSCWDQYLAMAFAQLTYRDSLRDIEACLRSMQAKLYHMGFRGKPWYWPDRVRVMQGIVLGMTGSGKTTLIKNIITQDLARVVGTPKDPRRLPMVIFDGKGATLSSSTTFSRTCTGRDDCIS
jgi:hypothetical protein